MKRAHYNVTRLLEAGRVERCHATPHHGTYQVGSHSWGMATIVLLLHPSPTLQLVRACLWHDINERWGGDVPAPARWNMPIMAKADKATAAKVEEILGVHPYEDLTEDDKVWLRFVDMLDYWMWSNYQLELGNRAAGVGKRQVEEAICKFQEELGGPGIPRELQEFFLAASMDPTLYSRTPDWPLEVEE